MVRQNSSGPPDTWAVSERPDGVWLSRPLAPGWVQEHRVVTGTAGPRIAETRVRPADPDVVPGGGIDSALLRSLTLRGVREAAEDVRLPVNDDLRPLERSLARGPKEIARRFRLALTAVAYVAFVDAGSRRPNVEVARVLGLRAGAVRDRLHQARTDPRPLLSGGGGRGVVGQPKLTDPGWDAMDVIMSYVFAAVGSSRRHRMRFEGDTWELLLLTAYLAVEAEARVPGLWELSLDDVHDLGRAIPPPAWVAAHNRSIDTVLRLGPDGPRVSFEPWVDPEP